MKLIQNEHDQVTAIGAFAQTLRRYTSLNHLAQAARAVLQNSSQINQMLSDLNRVDFHNVQEQVTSTNTKIIANNLYYVWVVNLLRLRKVTKTSSGVLRVDFVAFYMWTDCKKVESWLCYVFLLKKWCNYCCVYKKFESNEVHS